MIRYSLEELRRIFVDENTLIESKDPINPEKWRKEDQNVEEERRDSFSPTMTRITLA